VLGTPLLRSSLLTDGPLRSLSSRFMLPCAAMSDEASRRRATPLTEWAGNFDGQRNLHNTGRALVII
jgi:hypothetical protein